MKFNWRPIAGIFISVAALWLIARDVKIDQFAAALARADYGLALVSTGFILFSMWVRGYRWRALLDNRITPARAFNISNIGNLLNNVFPLRLGELARAYLVSRDGNIALMQCFSTVIVEQLLDVLVMLGLLMIILPFVAAGDIFTRAGTILAAVAFFAIATLIAVATWRGQIIASARKLFAWMPTSLRESLIHHGDHFLLGIRAIKLSRLATGILLSLVIWGGWVAGCCIMLAAIVPDLPWYVGVVVTWAIALGLSIPSAPSGAGLFEAAIIAALSLFNIPTDTALAFAVLLHLACFALAVILGVYALAREGQSLTGISHIARDMRSTRK